MYWADKVARQIIEAKKYEPYLVDDMFTPSGYAHIGSLRGPLVHDLVYKALINTGEKPKFTYVINDFDPIDGLPENLQESFSKYLGVPLRQVPSPKEGFKSFADYFASDYLTVMKKLGVEPEVLSSWDMYREGKFNEVIRQALDNADKIAEIYQKVSGSKKREQGWYPLQVICPKCRKLSTTRVYDWDGESVVFKCDPNLVSWAIGCSKEGRISPFDGNGKLPWKVDWPAHWKVMGVTVEGAGKDHSVAGGSRDIAKEISKEVFKIQEPYNLPYEFFTLGGKKMSASKGLGFQARDLLDLLPAEVGRFLFCRTDYRQEVNFDPMGTMAIPDLFDEYDRCFKAYIDGSDETLARIFEMSQIGEPPKKVPTFLSRFRDVVNYIQQPGVDIQKKFEEIKGGLLTFEELKNLEERVKYVRIWLDKYAPEEMIVQMSGELSDKVKGLTDEQKTYLRKVIYLVKNETNGDDLQLSLYKLSQDLGIDSKKAFSSIYIALIGKEHGPRAGHFLLQYPKDKVIKRLKEASGIVV